MQAASTDTKHERRLKAGLAWAACGPRDAQEMELKMMHLERFRLAVQKRPKTFETLETSRGVRLVDLNRTGTVDLATNWL